MRFAWFAMAVCGPACHPASRGSPSSKDSGEPGAASAASSNSSPAPPANTLELRHAPLGQNELSTTSGVIALRNIDAQIRGLEVAIAKHPQMVREMTLASALQLRAQYLGTLADYERAAAVADAAVARAPDDGKAWLMRARARSIYHRFADASSDLDRARTLGASESEVSGVRATILQALGQYSEALALRHELSVKKADVTSLGNEASVLADLGETEKAEQLFLAAAYAYRDVSPFPLAWLWFQQGSMWEKHGKPARAKALFRTACERVPGYAHASAHLALLSPPAEAIALLRPIVLTADDPEYEAELGVSLRDHGESAEGEKLMLEAAGKYEKLTQAHPEAFADHAARFWLGAGADGKKALLWARKNFDVRQTSDALELVVDSATAAHDAEGACAVAERALTLPRITGARRLLAARAFDSCGRRDRANEERRLAAIPE
jgi:tetratricopeptide (TPR) repeat protein